MNVKGISPVTMDRIAKSSVEETPESMGKVLQFCRHLSDESENLYTQRITSLISDIEKQGEVLNRRADIGEMQKYREMITSLLNETVSNGFAFAKEGKLGFGGRNKVYAIIRQVNGKLDEMTQKVLSTEKSNINLLDDVDDIRGLLVDLYL
jgi:uncharacterized protein